MGIFLLPLIQPEVSPEHTEAEAEGVSDFRALDSCPDHSLQEPGGGLLDEHGTEMLLIPSGLSCLHP